MKNRFEEPLCPGRAPSINQSAEVPPLHHSPLNPEYPLHCRLPANLQRDGPPCEPRTWFCVTFHHVPLVVAVVVAVCGPVVDVEALDGGVVVTGGAILERGWKKQIVKLQQSGEQLLYKERKLFQRLMAGLVISRCTKLQARS